MKWIKLFEQFGNNGSIQAINKLFLSFFISKGLNSMDLKKIETRNYIYFYTLRDVAELEFVFSKEISLLHYPLHKIELLLDQWESFTYRMLIWNELSAIYRKLLKDYLAKHINVDFRATHLTSRNWLQYEKNFKKLKKPYL